MSDWYYADNNTQQGPVLESELKGLLSSGKITPDSLVWKEGMANWTAAKDVSALNPAPAVASAASNPDVITPVSTSEIIGTPESLEPNADDAEKNKIFGIIAYLGILCLVSLFAIKNSPFSKYHGKQGLTLFVLSVAVWFAVWAVDLIAMFILPSSILGILIFAVSLIWIPVLVLAILGIINAAKGKCVPLPVIGGIKLIK